MHGIQNKIFVIVFFRFKGIVDDIIIMPYVAYHKQFIMTGLGTLNQLFSYLIQLI